MRRLADASLAFLIPFQILLYLYLAPYTKVEESFNIQATHDILTYGIPFKDPALNLQAQYDHSTFTGPIPRTFVGPLALAAFTWPFKRVLYGVDRQICARAVLGLFNAFCILAFRNSIARNLGRTTANWYLIFQASQFHVAYYASRTLPNFFAFGLTTLGLGLLMSLPGSGSTAASQRSRAGLVIFTVTGIIFRSEIAILLGTYTLFSLFRGRLKISDVIASGVVGLVIGLALTVPIDSFFWQRWPLWPELSGFWFNVMKGQSSNWGTSSFHHYFTSALPRLLLNPMTYQLCIPFTLAISSLRTSALDILIPNLAFVFIYSFQPHKEWRFIIYVIPPLTAVAAMGASWVWNRRAKSFAYQVLSLVIIASTLASFSASLGMLAISRLNYPGAEALNRLHAIAPTLDTPSDVIKVHMDTLSCMTGVTHFLEMPTSAGDNRTEASKLWIYDKTEDPERLLFPDFWEQFDFVLAERPEKVIGKWEIVDEVDGYTGLKLLRPGDSEPTSQEAAKSNAVIDWCKRLEMFMRTRVTRGWWLTAKMEPRIRILRK